MNAPTLPVIGLITGDTRGSISAEREFHQQLSGVADVATTRVPLFQISYGSLEKMMEGLPAAAQILAGCDASAIVWNSMSGSCLRGQETVNLLEQKVGIPVLVPSVEFVNCLHELDAKRIALVSPHGVELSLLEKIFFDKNGIDVIKVVQLLENFDGDVRNVDRITPDEILTCVKQADFQDVDAVVFDNPACALLPIITELDLHIKKPILPHNQVLMRAALRRVGVSTASIFIDPYFH